MEATVYQQSTGEIIALYTVASLDEMYDALQDGQSFLTGHYHSDDYYIRGGEPVAIPPKPSDGYSFDFDLGEWISIPGYEIAKLTDSRLAAVARINAAAGAVRRLYITDIPGQPTIYQMKETEARAWLADPDPDLSNYPFIAAEIGITATTGYEVAQVYLNLAAIYVQAAAQLEHARLGHIAMAETAPTPEDATAVADAFEALIS